MPPLVRRYIKTSFAFLVLGLLLGGYLLVAQFVLGHYPSRLLVTAHVHLLLVGFMLMIVMGVATWMFPRPGRDDARYRPELAEAVYWVMATRDGAPRRGGDAPRRHRARQPSDGSSPSAGSGNSSEPRCSS